MFHRPFLLWFFNTCLGAVCFRTFVLSVFKRLILFHRLFPKAEDRVIELVEFFFNFLLEMVVNFRGKRRNVEISSFKDQNWTLFCHIFAEKMEIVFIKFNNFDVVPIYFIQVSSKFRFQKFYLICNLGTQIPSNFCFIVYFFSFKFSGEKIQVEIICGQVWKAKKDSWLIFILFGGSEGFRRVDSYLWGFCIQRGTVLSISCQATFAYNGSVWRWNILAGGNTVVAYTVVAGEHDEPFQVPGAGVAFEVEKSLHNRVLDMRSC